MQEETFSLSPKQFREQHLNSTQNKEWLTELEIKSQTEILEDMKGRLERMKSHAEICQNYIKEHLSDHTYEMRQRRLQEEESLKEWQKKIKEQEEAIKATEQKIEGLEINLSQLKVYIKNITN